MLLRPARIGTLALLGGMIAIVLVGAEGWWIVLGITLFQAAASTLIVLWVDIPPARVRRPADHQAEHQWTCCFAPDCFAASPVPHQRQPSWDE